MNKQTKHTPGPWTTSRKDMDSFTENPETGETEHVVYVYRGEQPRIAIFAGELNNARAEGDLIAAAPDIFSAAHDLLESLVPGPDEESYLSMHQLALVSMLWGAIEKAVECASYSAIAKAEGIAP